jgi:hypothetical protein
VNARSTIRVAAVLENVESGDFAEWMGVPVYVIGVGRAAPPMVLVRKLTRRNGGRFFRIRSVRRDVTLRSFLPLQGLE